MRLARLLFLCFTVTAWLPATLHCALGDSGLLPLAALCCDAADNDCAAPGKPCVSDPCEALDAKLMKHAGGSIQVPPAGFVALAFALSTVVSEPAGAPLSPATTDSPPELPARWRFDVRAAGSPRAPDSVS